MGDIIVWKTAEEVAKIAGEMSKLVVGMAPEEAAAALGFTKTASGVFIKTVTTASSAAGAGVTAGEAIAGAAATGGATASTANLALYTTASGTTAVGGLGSIALPAAALALAAAGGYVIGNVTGEMIDSAFPDFFDGLFCSVSEFLTGDERSLAFIFNEKGEVFMPEASKQAVDDYLNKMLSEVNHDSATINGHTYNLIPARAGLRFGTSGSSKDVRYNEVKNISGSSDIYAFSFYIKDSLTTSFISKESFTIKVNQLYSRNLIDFTENTMVDTTVSTFIENGHKCASYSFGTGTLSGATFFPQYNSFPLSEGEVFSRKMYEKILYGDIIVSGSKVPNIGKFEIPDKPKIEVPSKYPSWMPIPLPATYPSKLPLETPDPNVDPDPSKITPYLPQPQPYPDKLPVPKPNPNPDRNPVVIPDPNPKPSPVPSPEVDPSIEPEIVPIPQPDPPPQPTPIPTPVPPLPVIPPIGGDAGLLHVYNPTTAQINEFGKWLWTTFSGDLLDTLAKLFNNPMDAVIGLHELYCTPSTGSSTTIKAGFLDSGVASRLVSSRYIEINCGAITVPEYWGNYLDYSPYTKVYCYLPFIGIVELNTDDIIGHGVQILYKVDSYNGSCIAMIITAKTADSQGTTYQFSGNCGVEVPITSGMKSAMQSALIGASTCAIGAAIGGAGVPVIAGMAVNNSLKSGFANKNTVSHSGSFGSSYGAMGIKKPYIIVKRPIQKKVYGYNKKYGYPAHEMVTIGKCSGYLRCRDFDVQSSTATEDEKKLIETLLKQGVYV